MVAAIGPTGFWVCAPSQGFSHELQDKAHKEEPQSFPPAGLTPSPAPAFAQLKGCVSPLVLVFDNVSSYFFVVGWFGFLKHVIQSMLELLSPRASAHPSAGITGIIEPFITDLT